MISLSSLTIKSITGKTLNFSDWTGKKLLIVNTASECGYTPQYAQLQELYERFQSELAIIACPCNQFGGQEPDEADAINQFCQINYGVSFTVTEKVEVKGENCHPLYNWLCQQAKSNGMPSDIEWNFHKFLVDENGQLTGSFPSATSPFDEELLDALKLDLI